MDNPVKPQKPIDGDILGTLINIAGRQRMLSQRIILHVVLASDGDSDAEEIAYQALETFKESHITLTEGNETFPGIFSQGIKDAYFDSGNRNRSIEYFTMLAERALKQISAKEPSKPSVHNLTSEASNILVILNEITSSFELEAKLYTENIKNTLHDNHIRLTEVFKQVIRISKEIHIATSNSRVISAKAGKLGNQFDVVASELQKLTAKINQLSHSAIELMDEPKDN